MHSSHPTIDINIQAISTNYTTLRQRLNAADCGAVVKANAYGLGVEVVATALSQSGCRHFFVATLEEGITLRKVLGHGVSIYVFHGVRTGEVEDFTNHQLMPVLNDLGQIQRWNNAGPAALHIDTGMRRLGLSHSELKKLPEGFKPALVMSHLACANDPQHPMNAQQLGEFQRALARFKGVPASLANSSGIFLGSDYHFDLARPGCSLYGISPNTSAANPVQNVVTLSAPVLQYRRIEKPECVGYGATQTVPAGTILATVELGYADGWLRNLSCRAHGFVDGTALPLVGRVSMDMVSIDVSRLPEAMLTQELRITFIGSDQPVDAVAKEAGTIGYEIFTRLGSRVKRVYS